MARTDQLPQRVWSAALAHTVTKGVIVVVMGVSGAGKSTVAALLAAALGCQFQEGDDLHPRENVEKMHSGIPLTDADRMPWLYKIADEIDGWRTRGECGVMTCSALKRSYRDIIIGDRSDVVLVYLKGSHELIRRRMIARHEHFMPVALLDSQFATLEEPTPDEHPIIVDIGGNLADIAHEIVCRLEDRPHGTNGPAPPATTAAWEQITAIPAALHIPLGVPNNYFDRINPSAGAPQWNEIRAARASPPNGRRIHRGIERRRIVDPRRYDNTWRHDDPTEAATAGADE
jgi:gluconokinase